MHIWPYLKRGESRWIPLEASQSAVYVVKGTMNEKEGNKYVFPFNLFLGKHDGQYKHQRHHNLLYQRVIMRIKVKDLAIMWIVIFFNITQLQHIMVIWDSANFN